MPDRNTGAEAYQGLSYAAGREHGSSNPARVVASNELEASNQLRDAGIPGIVYDAGRISGWRGPKTRNYVMFPGTEGMIEILKKYGMGVPIGAAGILSQYGNAADADEQ